jgi:hypothetical protein
MGWKTGLEPATLGITIRCSNQLSYIHRRFQTRSDCVLSRVSRREPGAPDRNRTCNRRLRRPVLYPVELRAQGIKCSAPDAANARLRIRRKRNHAAYSIFTLAAGTHCPAPHILFGRGRGIRTLDVQLPKLALYQAELYPAVASYRVKPAKHCRKKKRVPKHPSPIWRARRDSNSRPPSS